MWSATLHTVLFPCCERGPADRGRLRRMPTDLLFLRDAELRSFDAVVVAVDGDRVELDRTAFYATGGGQPHDGGTIRWDGGVATVVDVRKEGGSVWHRLDGE